MHLDAIAQEPGKVMVVRRFLQFAVPVNT